MFRSKTKELSNIILNPDCILQDDVNSCKRACTVLKGVSLFDGLEHWTGLLDWTTGLAKFYAKALMTS